MTGVSSLLGLGRARRRNRRVWPGRIRGRPGARWPASRTGTCPRPRPPPSSRCPASAWRSRWPEVSVLDTPQHGLADHVPHQAEERLAGIHPGPQPSPDLLVARHVVLVADELEQDRGLVREMVVHGGPGRPGKVADIGHSGAGVAGAMKEPPGGGQNGKDRRIPGNANGLTRADNGRGHQGIVALRPGLGLPPRSRRVTAGRSWLDAASSLLVLSRRPSIP